MEDEEACLPRDAVTAVIQAPGLPRRHPAEGVLAQIASLLGRLLENTVAAAAVKPVMTVEWMWIKSNLGMREGS